MTIKLLQNILEQAKKAVENLENVNINIEDMDKAIQDLMNIQIEYLKTENLNIEKLIDLVKENNKETSNQNKILGLIYDALVNLSDDQKEQFNKIMVMLEKGQASYDQVVVLLNAIKEQDADNSTKLLKLVSENNDVSKKILAALDKISKKFESYGDDVKALLVQIASKEFSVNLENDVNLNFDMDAILNKLDEMAKSLVSIDNSTGATAEYSKAILEAVSKLGINVTDSLNTIIKNMGNDSTKLDALIALLQKMDANNETRNQKILDAIAKLGANITGSINVILEKMGNDSTKLDKLIALLEQLDANNETRNQKILDAISKLGIDVAASLTKLIDLGETNNNLQVKTNELIANLYNYIKNMPVGEGGEPINIDVNGIIESINNAGDNINAKMDDVLALLMTLNSNVVQGNEDNRRIGAEILDAISKLGINVSGGINAILAKMDGNTEQMEKLLAFLKTMDANNETRTQRIIDAISKLGIDVAANLTKLIDLGETNNDLHVKTNELIENLYNYIKNMPVGESGKPINIDVNGIIESINNAGDGVNARLDDILALLKTLNSNVVQGNEDNRRIGAEILDAISKLGVNVSGGINAILAKMDGNTEQMEELLAFLKTMDANDEVRNQKVLDAIANLGADIIGALNKLEIKAPDMSGVIDAINKANGDVNKNLKTIIDLIGALDGHVVEGDNKIVAGIDNLKKVANNILKNLSNSTNITNNTYNAVEEILNGLKDGSFTIKVNVNVTCESNNGTQPVHEGEITNILNARESKFDEDDVTGINNASTGVQQGAKTIKANLNGQYGLKGPHIITENNDGTVTVSNLNGTIVRNHVPKE